MNIRINRAVAVVTAAALALTSVGVAPALAAGKSGAANAPQTAQTATDFSSHRRYYGHRRGYGNAAAFAAIVGAIGAYAAAREYRKARERSYYYGGYPNGYGYG